MHIEPFFDSDTATVSYVVSDSVTSHCAIIDSVQDFDLHSGRLGTVSADKMIDYVSRNKLKVEWILETHVHADHLTAASYLQQKLGGKIGIGEHIKKVLAYWVPIFNTEADTPLDGSQFDVLFVDGAQFNIGSLEVKVMHTPGHTPDSICYVINDAVFVGDMIFMPYVGTGRTDFPGGGAGELYRSIQRVLALPAHTRIYTCHEYPPAGQQPMWESNVTEQKQKNIIANETVTEAEFIAARNKKDLNKPAPKLLLPSLQVNLRAGKLGVVEKNQKHYLKLPVTF